MKLFILLSMVFCHIIDDYCLQQHCLSKLKQRIFWQKEAPHYDYRHDYIMALIMHGFSWAFMIMLPIWIYGIAMKSFDVNIIVFLINAVIHSIIDDLKANRFRINLIQDQLLHLVQIVISWAMLVL